MKKKCDKNYLNNSFFGNEFYDLYFRAISTKLIWVEKLAASSEIRKEELVSLYYFNAKFWWKKRGKRVSLNNNNNNNNNNNKLSRREANESEPLLTMDVQDIINFGYHYVVLDFVLVYEENDGEETSREVLRFRRKYMNNLQKSQLEFEEVSFLENMS